MFELLLRGDRLVAADWDEDGDDTPAVFRPTTVGFFFRHTMSAGVANSHFAWTAGGSGWLPVAGAFALR